MTDNAMLIPFGSKYRGQPVEVLRNDPSYTEWLMGQAWFAAKYPAIHTLVINHFGEPHDTPAHNELQLRFLDGVLRLQCSFLIGESIWGKGNIWCPYSPEDEEATLTPAPVFEQGGIDVQWLVEMQHPWQWYLQRKKDPTEWWCPCIALECKPSLGDDYPAVLRFIKSCKSMAHVEDPTYWGLVVESFSAQGGTWDAVKEFFRLSDVALVTLSEVMAYELPVWGQMERRFAEPQSAPPVSVENQAYAATRAWLKDSSYGPFLSDATEESRP